MSTTTRVAPQRKAPPAPPPLVPATPTATAKPARRSVLARAFENTPGRLRAAGLAGVVVCLLFAVLGANAFRARGDALDAARAGAVQVVRVQKIATDLAQADAVITNAFLQGAKEAPGSYGEYQKAVASASQGIAEAARAQPADAAVLAQVNDSLTRYAGAVETARTYNRFGYQIGSAYLRQASDLLRKPSSSYAAMLPTLQAVADAEGQRVDDDFGSARRAGLLLFGSGFAVLAGLLAVQFWLARRTRRILNVPLTAGTVTVLAALLVGVVVMLSSQSAADTVRDTHYAATRALSQARISAFDAKANEALTLVYQGSGQAFEKTYTEQLERARSEVKKASMAGVRGFDTDPLASWAAVHAQIRNLDDKRGDWQGAVQKATGAGAGTSADAFQRFDTDTASHLKTEAADVSEGLQSSHGILVVLGWLTLVLGLIAAVLSWRGVAQRLEEYR